MSISFSSRFEQLFDTLPESTQKLIVRKHLIPLLDRVHTGKALKILASTRKLSLDHSKIPPLRFKEKKAEVGSLWEQLAKEEQKQESHGHGQRRTLRGMKNDTASLGIGFGVGLGPRGEDCENPANLLGKECSKQEALLREAVDSVAEWLNDIWTNVAEYGTEFIKAHGCLMYSIGTLDHVQTGYELVLDFDNSCHI